MNWVLEITQWAGEISIHLIVNVRIIPFIYLQYLQVNPMIFLLELEIPRERCLYVFLPDFTPVKQNHLEKVEFSWEK